MTDTDTNTLKRRSMHRTLSPDSIEIFFCVRDTFNKWSPEQLDKIFLCTKKLLGNNYPAATKDDIKMVTNALRDVYYRAKSRDQFMCLVDAIIESSEWFNQSALIRIEGVCSSTQLMRVAYPDLNHSERTKKFIAGIIEFLQSPEKMGQLRCLRKETEFPPAIG